VGPTEADTMLGEVFRIAFEKRETFDCTRTDARPWLYGIATRLLAKHRRREARQLSASARLLARRTPPEDFADGVATRVDACTGWQGVVEAVGALPRGERDALLLFAWEDLSYEEIAIALDIPIGTVRSRLNRARRRMRELAGVRGRERDTTHQK